jgi:hypothetical protein
MVFFDLLITYQKVEVKDKRGRRQQGNRATGTQNLHALREGDWCDGFGNR